MSQKLPNMLESTIQKIREMLDVNTVVGTPITTPDGVTIIPVSKFSVGFGGGGSDFMDGTEEAFITASIIACDIFQILGERFIYAVKGKKVVF